MKPQITIILSTYNRAHFIVETLLSIQNQTFKNWECLIIDDGGIDNTLKVINPILKEDNRFKYLNRPKTYKKGLPGCRNYGLDLAAGEFIIFFDDDDIIHPNNLKTCYNLLVNENIDFCTYQKKSFEKNFDYRNFDVKKKGIIKKANQYFLEDIITNKYPLSSCTVMWSKDCFKNNIFNENLMYAEEWELYQRILSNNKKGICIDKVLYFNRKHPNSNTGEFWNKNPVRLNSKKEAVRLIVDNLVTKNLLSIKLFKYLFGLAISYRDKKLFNYIIVKSNVSYNKSLFLHFKYWLYPLWKVYKRANKKIN